MVAIRHSIQTDKARKRVVSRLPFVFYVLGEKQKLPDERAELKKKKKMVHRSTKLYPLPANQRALLL